MFKMKLAGACAIVAAGFVGSTFAGGMLNGIPLVVATMCAGGMAGAGGMLAYGLMSEEFERNHRAEVDVLHGDLAAAARQIERLRDAIMGRHAVPADIVAMANGLEKLAVDIGHEAVAMLEKARALRDSMDGLGRHMDDMAQENDRLTAEADKVREIATIATRPAPVQAPDIAPAGPAGAPVAAPSLDGRPEEFAPQAARRDALAGLERTLMSTTAMPATGK